MIFEGIVNAIQSARQAQGAQRRMSLDELGALLVTPGGLPFSYLARNNRIFGATFGTGTAIAPVTATPTTAADWGLFNNEPDGGRDYYIIRAGAHLVSGTAGLGMSLMGCVSLAQQRSIATPPSDYASSIKTSMTGGPFDSKAIFDQATTLVGGTPAWITLESRDQVSAVSLGGLVATNLSWMKVPPGFLAGFAVLAPVGTTALFGVDVVWAEF